MIAPRALPRAFPDPGCYDPPPVATRAHAGPEGMRMRTASWTAAALAPALACGLAAAAAAQAPAEAPAGVQWIDGWEGAAKAAQAKKGAVVFVYVHRIEPG